MRPLPLGEGFRRLRLVGRSEPGLTTVALPAWQMDVTAASLRIDGLDDKRPSVTDVCLPTTLQRRESA